MFLQVINSGPSVVPEYTTSLVQPAAGGGVTAVRIADGDGIFPASHVATILLC